jgi:hypothetical protein
MSFTTNPCASKDVLKEIINALPLDLDVFAIKVEQMQLYTKLRKDYGFVS